VVPSEHEQASEPEQAPELEQTREPVSQQSASSAPSRFHVGRGLWLIIASAALLGLVAGVGVVLRGDSLGHGATGDTPSRPTFVIGASVSPVPSGSPSPVVAGSAAGTDYVVQPGDTLRSIAQNVYGDADEWPRIYDANRELIGSDPDALKAGMRLRVP
jgi:nucleoid-associated protein YgaU